MHGRLQLCVLRRTVKPNPNLQLTALTLTPTPTPTPICDPNPNPNPNQAGAQPIPTSTSTLTLTLTRRTVNLPTRQLDLHTFWSSLRLVIYDADPAAAEHLRGQIRYLACVQARHLRGEEVAAAEQRLPSEQQLPSETPPDADVDAEADVDADADVPELYEDADAHASASAERAGAVRFQRPPLRPNVHGANWRRVFKCFVHDEVSGINMHEMRSSSC